ncbi:MAG: tetratricopeptide repeat protein [Saprospiraceae bacterium]
MKCSLMMIVLCFTSQINAQVLDEETGFIYVKAEYLYETGRYDEAITQYNAVIAKDPKYKDALIHRGIAKYAMAAYKGAKMDAIQSIDLKGINAEAAALLGRAFAQMNDANAAINSLTAAIALDQNNAKYHEWRAGIYENEGQILKACQDYEAAMNNGSASAEVKARNLCGTRPKPKTETTQPSTTNTQNPSTPTQNQDPNVLGDNEVLSEGTKEPDDKPQTVENTHTNPVNHPSSVTDESAVRVTDDSEPAVVDENLPKNDDTANILKIDEELTIQIYGQELGKRQIKEVPSILILADENGKVAINFCVNKDGSVVSAEFNSPLSTIAKKSLVSLALRKNQRI